MFLLTVFATANEHASAFTPVTPIVIATASALATHAELAKPLME